MREVRGSNPLSSTKDYGIKWYWQYVCIVIINNLPRSKKITFNKKTKTIVGIAFVAIAIVLFSLFKLEEIKSKNRLKEIAAQEEKEISVILERERIEQKRIDEENQQKGLEESERNWQTSLRNICLEAADDAYFSYAELNGRKNEDGTIWANNSVWDRAEERKQDATDLCFKKYPVN